MKSFATSTSGSLTLADWFTVDGQPLALICECATTGCTTALEVPYEVYGRVRQADATYLVATGHEDLSTKRSLNATPTS